MDGSHPRDERRERIRTAAAVARVILWIIWMLFDPRRLI